MSKKMGRPPKISTEEKIAIINRYYISRTGEHPDAIGAHGIYQKLATFAKELGYHLEAYDFSRDETTRTYIAKFSTPTVESISSPTLPTYIPLDIITVLNKSQQNIEATLTDRETYYRTLHMQAAQALESNRLFAEKIHHLQNELECSRKKCQMLETQNNDLTHKLRVTETDVSYLKRIIRKDVEPERAHLFLQSLTSRDAVIQAAQKSVMSSIDSLTQEDRRMRKEAEKETDISDLNSLLQLI